MLPIRVDRRTVLCTLSTSGVPGDNCTLFAMTPSVVPWLRVLCRLYTARR